MQTIEFQSVVENDVIRIPEAYRGAFTTPIRVMICTDDQPNPKIHHRTKTKPLTPSDFSALHLDTRGWKFNREEADERG